MNESKISVRYAKALFLAAKEKKVEDRVREDMKLMLITCTDSPDFLQVIYSPIITDERKKELISSIFKNYIHPISLQFINLVLDNNRGNQLQFMARRYLALHKIDQNIIELSLTTPVELENEVKKKMISLVKGQEDKKIELIEKVDPDMIGGFILRIDDMQMDASVSTHLNKIKRGLITGTYKRKI